MDADDTRRYSRDEMRRILEAASEPAASPVPVDDEGLTLPEIKSIAREVGIDPDRVEQVSRSLATETPLESEVSLGTYQREIRFGRRLNREEMVFVAEEADAFFGTRGEIRQTSGYVEWYSQEVRAFVGVVDRPAGTSVRAILDRAPQFYLGGGLLGFIGLWLAAAAWQSTTGVAGAVGALAVAVAAAAGVVRFWHWRKRAVLDQIDELLKVMTAGPIR